MTDSRWVGNTWKLADLSASVRELVKLLNARGHALAPRSSIAIAVADLDEMEGYFAGTTHTNFSADRRPAWRRAIGLADIATKILAVRNHTNFEQLEPHFQLLLGNEEISLFTKTEKENDANNKLFELLIGASAMRFMTDCELEPPDFGGASKNPDLIGTWRGRRWAIACKALHSDNPRAIVQRIEDGCRQIKKSGIPNGIIVLNGKNLIPHDECWPGEKLNGEWHYGAHEHIDHLRDVFIEQFKQRAADVLHVCSGGDDCDTEAELRDALKIGRQNLLAIFANTNARPFMPIVWLTVVGCKTPEAGKVAPTIFRFVNAFEVDDQSHDSETNDLMKLLSLSIQNQEPSEENLARA